MKTDPEDLMRRPHEAERRSQFDVIEVMALLGALALITIPACKRIARRWRIRNPMAASEGAIDKALKDTFPASDPPASRYIDIPANRR